MVMLVFLEGLTVVRLGGDACGGGAGGRADSRRPLRTPEVFPQCRQLCCCLCKVAPILWTLTSVD